MSLKTQFRDFSNRFDERSAAEKLLLAVICVGVVFWLYFILVFEPLSASVQSAQQQLTAAQARLTAMQQREQIAITTGNEDPNRAVRQRIERAIGDQAVLQRQIEELTGNLVTPQSMTRLLTSMLEQRAGLTLVRVENQMPQPMRSYEDMMAEAASDEPTTANRNADQLQVYKHSLALELEGDFLSLINYLRSVESFNERFFWDEISFVQTEWPNARVTLRLHTLSAEEGFVGV
ncbi:type II secretion system protein GspM [Pseudohongiella spirulinae]|uniref:MSHA biogenesis protein MshJ n=1 Tax=Pseudohongiella spirulinae TaxID=1249552 RepID=A0A0S2KAQ8_9GAMM|nr:type II secretion system protein GspM [Pseudohongiella spirulinae]ALO45156.1 hypothetical protein PS2015_470 [Pseudohongiella spirulinae]